MKLFNWIFAKPKKQEVIQEPTWKWTIEENGHEASERRWEQRDRLMKQMTAHELGKY